MKCVIISGSPECDIDFIESAAKGCDYLMCADMGYSHAKKAWLNPDFVAGDFDSCKDEVEGDFELLRLSTDKDFTDTHVCVQNALEKGYKDITILAATGGRLDHSIANLYLLEYIASNGGRGVILSEKERVELLCEGKSAFPGLNGLTFSLFPFGCGSVTLSIKGAEYELSDYTLKSEMPIGVSNVFSGNLCEINISQGKALIIINRSL